MEINVRADNEVSKPSLNIKSTDEIAVDFMTVFK